MLYQQTRVREPRYRGIARRVYIANRLLGGTIHNSTVVAALAASQKCGVPERTVRIYIRTLQESSRLI